MIDITQKEEKIWDEALTLLENPNGLTDADLESASRDNAVLSVYNELLDCREAAQQRFDARRFDATSAWEQFNAKRKPHHRSYILLGALSGIAAALLLLFGMHIYNKVTTNLPDGIMVFEADDAPQEIQLVANNDKVTLKDANRLLTIDGIKPHLSGHTLRAIDYTNVNIPNEENHRLTTPRGHDFQLILSDGTMAWLNADSQIDYPAKFTSNERIVQLQGEAFLEVAKDSEHPFIIKAKNFEAKVLGTKLNIRSYSDEDSRVTLIEGSVEVKNTRSGSTVRLEPGEEAQFMADGSIQTTKVDVDSYVYWKEGFFYFDNVSLVDIMQTLGRWYNVNVIFANTAAMNYKLHFLCDRRDGVEHAITLLNRMEKAKLRFEQKTIIVE